ncbi:hypothetical protein [Microbulbifer sp. TYP-18]|uniref:hypothetical protein n=1 Tax=Microbulbifer sp. TYP-18 TaxID=3230024 RepID=UPI0034C64BE5
MLRFFLVSAILLFSQVSFGHTSQVKIHSLLIVEGTNLVYIYPEGGVNNPPSCHGSNGDYISFSMDRPLAKEYLSMLMMAFAAQKTVTLFTKGDCIDQSVSETLSYIHVYN